MGMTAIVPKSGVKLLRNYVTELLCLEKRMIAKLFGCGTQDIFYGPPWVPFDKVGAKVFDEGWQQYVVLSFAFRKKAFFPGLHNMRVSINVSQLGEGYFDVYLHAA